LYGPRVSSREGRPDHLASVLGQLRHDSPRGYSSSSAAPAAAAEGDDDLEAQQQQLAASPLRRPAPIEERGESLAAREEEEERGDDGGDDDDDRIAAAAASFSSSAAAASAAPKPPTTPSVAQKHKKQRLYERISVLAPQDPSKLVQVNLRDVSYHVPVQLDKHAKTTVVNQSVCYFAYEFFRRLASLCRRGGGCWGFSGSRGGTGGGGNGDEAPAKYQVRDVASLFVPYESRSVLSGINLVLKPGKTYVVLGPPGSGKTSLLQAVSGRLPNRKSSLTGKPVQGRPHVLGRIEYNGVSIEVREATATTRRRGRRRGWFSLGGRGRAFFTSRFFCSAGSVSYPIPSFFAPLPSPPFVLNFYYCFGLFYLFFSCLRTTPACRSRTWSRTWGSSTSTPPI
jgi:hypothetical protein